MADFLEEAVSGRRHNLRGDSVTIGREQGCEIIVDDTSVSRRHCTLNRGDKGWTLTDNGSRNGTTVKGNRLAPNAPVPLPADARFLVGSLELIMRHGYPDAVLATQPPSVMAKAREQALQQMQAQKTATMKTMRDPGRTTDLAAIAQPPRGLDARIVALLEPAQRALHADQSLEQLFGALLTLVLGQLSAARASVRPWSTDKGRLERGLTLNRRDAEAGPTASIIFASDVSEKVLRERRAVIFGDFANDPEFSKRKTLEFGSVTSAVAAPLLNGDDVLGVVYADVCDGSYVFNENDAALLSMLAAVSSVSFAAVRSIAALRALAER